MNQRSIDSEPNPRARSHPLFAHDQALVVTAFGATDKGRVRRENQDQFCVATLTGTLWVQQSTVPGPRVQCSHAAGHLLVIADGMGGHAGGARASALAIETVEQFAIGALSWLLGLNGTGGASNENGVQEELKHALQRADAAIRGEAARVPSLRGMGTTLTLVYSIGNQLYVAHAGDSRCYLLREGKLRRLTRDHTLVRELVDAGVMPERSARRRYAHIVTNAVGGDSGQGTTADAQRIGLMAGDVVLLASDGLHDVLSDDEIARVLLEQPLAERACCELIRVANDRGGPDNITAVVARYDEAGSGR